MLKEAYDLGVELSYEMEKDALSLGGVGRAAKGAWKRMFRGGGEKVVPRRPSNLSGAVDDGVAFPSRDMFNPSMPSGVNRVDQAAVQGAGRTQSGGRQVASSSNTPMRDAGWTPPASAPAAGPAPAKKLEPATVRTGSSPASTAAPNAAVPASAETQSAAKQLESTRAMAPEAAAAERAAWSPEMQKSVGEVTQRGATGGYGMAASLAPAAIGAGVGAAVDGREGALVGAGIGAGARLGAGGLLRSAREARGIHSTLGRTGAADLSKVWSSPQASTAALGAGALGAAGGAGGYALGQATKKEESPWYNPLGLTRQDVGNVAMPMMQSQRLGMSPQLSQYWGQQMGLVPSRMPQGY